MHAEQRARRSELDEDIAIGDGVHRVLRDLRPAFRMAQKLQGIEVQHQRFAAACGHPQRQAVELARLYLRQEGKVGLAQRVQAPRQRRPPTRHGEFDQIQLYKQCRQPLEMRQYKALARGGLARASNAFPVSHEGLFGTGKQVGTGPHATAR